MLVQGLPLPGGQLEVQAAQVFLICFSVLAPRIGIITPPPPSLTQLVAIWRSISDFLGKLHLFSATARLFELAWLDRFGSELSRLYFPVSSPASKIPQAVTARSKARHREQIALDAAIDQAVGGLECGEARPALSSARVFACATTQAGVSEIPI